MNELRARWDLDPEVVFLNHGSFGATPRVVLAAQSAWRARLEAQPVRFLAREIEGHLDAARSSLADFVGAAADDLAFLPNATHGLNTVLRSLRLEPGDEILATSHGYNAARTAATFVCERAGARLVEVPLPWPIAGPEQVLAALEAGFSPRTRLVLIDHVTSPSGLVLPVAEVIAAAAARGVDVLVDGAHAPGMFPLDLEALGAAYYTGNCHKWLCAPKGAAFLHVRRDRQEGVRPLAISHGANDPRTDRSRFRLEFDWTGSADPTPYLCVPDCIEFLRDLGPGGLAGHYARIHALTLRGRDLLCAALEVPPPAPDAMLGALATVPLPDAEPLAPRAADPLQVWLREAHSIEVPVVRFPGGRAIRIATQAYVSEQELVSLVDALRAWRELGPRA